MIYDRQNDLVAAMANRAKALANHKLDVLRMIAAEDGDTPWKAKQEVGHLSRGELTEQILYDEFHHEEP